MEEAKKDANAMLTEAASALTSLGVSPQNRESTQSDPTGHERPNETNQTHGAGGGDVPGGSGSDRMKTEATEVKDDTKLSEEDVPLTFPQKLMEVISDESNAEVVSWLPHGRGFMIYQKKRFATEIMPKYFKQSKFTSFTRKLNRWGFTRMNRGPETGAYFHPYFQKGNLRLCLQMCCHSDRPSTLAQQRAIMGRVGAQAFCVNNAMAGLSLDQNQLLNMPQTPQANANQTLASPNAGLLRLRQLQQQQEQLLMQQQRIKQQMEAFAKTLPQDILLGEPSSQSMPGADRALSAGSQQQMEATQPQRVSLPSQQGPFPFPMQNMQNSSASAQGMSEHDPAYTQAIVNAAVEALQRSNTNQYLATLMSQGKAHPAESSMTLNPAAFQQQLRQTVQAQLEQMKRYEQQQQQQQQVAATSSAMKQAHQGQMAQQLAASAPPAKLQQPPRPARRESAPTQRKGAKRASAA